MNRTLHGRLRIRILSSSAESTSHEGAIVSALEDKIRISARPCNILYMYHDHKTSCGLSGMVYLPTGSSDFTMILGCMT